MARDRHQRCRHCPYIRPAVHIRKSARCDRGRGHPAPEFGAFVIHCLKSAFPPVPAEGSASHIRCPVRQGHARRWRSR
ncbi:hypothetical protein Y88_1275 [Novosphingobium nitrogenifigens DSM 19370]|uniref:Uncharacterized protein n=1 Tax=Novosphingobium nitrogenifigens DSM 19370 TaxID=983920 RepID=F1Z813_9SPHN|nr:hypothetical protein Y88_1275 [Novosphingobium nitrogenifigens DSM 19370]